MFRCLECGRKFKTASAAERAARDGCPKCGGVDVDLDAGLPAVTLRDVALEATQIEARHGHDGTPGAAAEVRALAEAYGFTAEELQAERERLADAEASRWC